MALAQLQDHICICSHSVGFFNCESMAKTLFLLENIYLLVSALEDLSEKIPFIETNKTYIQN